MTMKENQQVPNSSLHESALNALIDANSTTPYIKNKNDKDLTKKIRDRLTYDEEGRCTNAHKVLSDPGLLRDAYESIKTKSGNMVTGTDRETLDGITEEWFSRTSVSLSLDKFRPRPSRRVYIPKPNGKMRPIGISSPRDKIVQQAMRLILEIVLEPQFLPTSHGFRPSRGCHSALREIQKWKGVPWLLEGDIKSFFDNIDHHILCDLLGRHFKDANFFRLYWKLVKSGYVEWDTEKERKKMMPSPLGVPQGGIVSPILSNLMLNEFDLYIRNLAVKSNPSQKKRKVNPSYAKLSVELRKLKSDWEKKKAIGIFPSKIDRKVKRDLLTQRRAIKSSIPLGPPQIKYVRYADDWVIGVWGCRKEVVRIRDLARDFLASMKLELSMEKTLITNTRLERARFLGTDIKRQASRNLDKIITRSNGLKSKSPPSGNIIMTAPIDKITKKLLERKFLVRRKGELIPQSIPKFLVLPVKDLIIRFRSILMGFLNYFSFVHNRWQLSKIYWFLRESLRKTISKKLNLNLGQFIKRFSRDISLVIKKRNGETVTLDFKRPDLKSRPGNFFGPKTFEDPLSLKDWKISTITALGQACCNCGSKLGVEMHHIKHIKTLNPKLNSFDRMMAKINRKQVPLCRPCHQRVHKGTYQGMSLQFFQHIKWQGTAKWA